MRYILLAILTLSIVIQPLKLSLLVVEYTTNNAVFTEKYCENKDKPELKCNGKCHLNKELLKTSKSEGCNEKSNGSDKKTQSYEIVYLKPVALQLTVLYYSTNYNTYYCNHYYRLNTTQSFHPPQGSTVFIAC